jgi:hypothetical protein
LGKLSRNAARRERLTKQFAENWQMIRSKVDNLPTELNQDDIFICPLCHTVFLPDKWSELSLEHIPPDAVGGKPIAITCKSCNSKSGSGGDAHLANYQQLKDFMDGIEGASWKGTYSVNNLPFQLHATFMRGSQGEWIINPNRSYEKHIQEVSETIDNTLWQDMKFNLKFRGPIPRRAELAILRSAYLWGFAKLGYLFLFNGNFELIRQQILHPNQDLLPVPGILSSTFSQEQIGINLIREPLELRSYFIVIPIKSALGTIRIYGVVLPAPIEGGMKIYDRLQERRGYEQRLEISSVTKDYVMNHDPAGFLSVWG